MPRLIAAIALIAVLAVGGGLIATAAYQAGLGTAISTAGGGAVAPVVIPPYGYGYGYGPHPFGFGFFGFLGALVFLFIVFGLLRAIFGRGGPGRHGGRRDGWGGPWSDRAHESFEEWHRRAHGPTDAGPSAPAGTSGPV